MTTEAGDGSPGQHQPARVQDALEEPVAVLRQEAAQRGWFRLEYAILVALGVMFACYIAAYFLLGLDLESLRSWGYVGVFFIAMAGSATIVLPSPSTFAVIGGGAFLDPVLGIPAPLLVGLIAGLGDAIGEFSGYGLGYAGTDMLRHHRFYSTFTRWMDRRGTITVFLMSTFPNPFFDLVGASAGAARMPPKRFFVACLCGKIIKDLFLAFGGSFSIGLLRGIL